jgi:hypothetical protein
MKMRSLVGVVLPFALPLLVQFASDCSRVAFAGETRPAKVLIVSGPSQHPPGTHEAAATARLLEYCVEHIENGRPLDAEVVTEWPRQATILEEAAAVVFVGDQFPPERMDEPGQIKADLANMMARGCGLVCIHFATGLRANHVAEDGDHPLLRWMGGYYASGCKHHRSVARVLTATIVPDEGPHPVLQGWGSFTFDDEPYWKNYFGKDGPASNVTSLAYTMLPIDEPKKETVAWAVQREDGGRGVGIVFPHYFRNWRIDDLRTLILNGIVWSTKGEIPADGVVAPLPDDLAVFQPAAVEPQPRGRKP